MGVVSYIRDGLINALTGAGTSTDPRAYNHYVLRRLSFQEIDAAFRSSWLMRKGITKPANDMVRNWRDWQADSEQIELLEAEEKRLGLKDKFKRAEILRGLGGAGMVLYIKGQDPAQPIDATQIKAGMLTRIHVWHRSKFSLGPMIVDWDSEWFGHPSYYELAMQGANGGLSLKFHPSRVVAFRGEPVADISSTTYDDTWWGDSKVQTVKDAIDNVHAGEDGFAALIKDARNRRISVPKLLELTATTDGEARLQKRMQAFALGESMFGVSWIDGGDGDGKGAEKIEDRQMVWAGIPDIKQSNLSVAAAALNMPETVLLGRSPAGMNATGSSDLELWDEEVNSRQDLEMRPCMDQLDIALIPSALGAPDESIWWEFAPLSSQSEKDEATTFFTTMQAIEKLQATGSVPPIAFDKGLQNLMTERGWMPGLDAALAEVPENERFPSESAEPAPDPNAPVDPNAAIPMRRAANDARFLDATPRSLYVSRPVLNVAELQAWATKQGLGKLQPDLHVTIAYSTTPVDWMKIDGEDWNQEKDGTIAIPPGGVRLVQPLGDRTAVLLFTSSRLCWRHEQIVQAGASWDYPEYQPHISLTGEPVDLSGVEAYQGPIKLGPELFSEIVENWGAAEEDD